MEFVNTYWFQLVTIGLLGLSIGWDSEGLNTSRAKIFTIQVGMAVLTALLFTAEGQPFIPSSILVALAIMAGKTMYVATQNAWLRPLVVWSVYLPLGLSAIAFVMVVLALTF